MTTPGAFGSAMVFPTGATWTSSAMLSARIEDTRTRTRRAMVLDGVGDDWETSDVTVGVGNFSSVRVQLPPYSDSVSHFH